MLIVIEIYLNLFTMKTAHDIIDLDTNALLKLFNSYDIIYKY